MSFPRYPKYKDSGVEWLGQVPEHWGVSRLGFEAWVRARLGWRGLKAEEYVDDGFVFLSTPNLKGAQIDFDSVSYISQDRFDESPEIKIRVGDVLLVKDGSTLGTVNVVRDLPRPATVNGSIAVITPGANVDGVFLHYFFESANADHVIQLAKGGMGVPHLFQSDLRMFNLVVPPLSEQRDLSTFLDRETAKIDALIAEQQQLIERLTEKRQATILHAVTKGLNPDAPMKASGIEWLGEVPAHWTVPPIKSLARIGNGSTPNRERQDYWREGSFPWLNSGVVNTDPVDPADQFVTSVALRDCHLPIVEPPAILVGITGQGRTRGMSAILLFEATISQHLAFLRPIDARMDVFFLKRVIEMAYSHLRDASDDAGSTKAAITCEDLRNLKVPRPPVQEQRAIVHHLSQFIVELDALIASARHAIDLLQERRTALISAAVTGQIDVRGLVPSEAA